LATGALFAHYQFLHYQSRSAPFTPAPEKFDLNALPDRAVRYYVAEDGPEQKAAGDSFTSILSQIRMAAEAWSAVETSELRLVFGGLFTPDSSQSSPRVEVLFDEIPPGLVALGGPTTRGEMVNGADGAFVPILRSVLILQKDLTDRPSWSDAFFLTVVHEMGHALGLQHTLTSSVMSTQVTRASTRSKPLGVDDAAGLSLLYPAPGYASKVGAISGRVTLGGSGVHLASVVALAPSGAAVSALTDPDGYYRIAGVPPGLYYLYVHPLPPAAQDGLGPADIVLPVDPAGVPFPASGLFDTQFYPGTKDVFRAHLVIVEAGGKIEGYDFRVSPRGPLDLFGVTTYSFPGRFAVKPAYVNGTLDFLVASGVGLTKNGAPTAGLNVSVLGGSTVVAPNGVKAYPPAPDFLQVDLQFNPFSGEGARHLIFSRNNDLYILPAGATQVFRQPPSITSVSRGVDGSGRTIVSVAGKRLFAETRIFFDGLPAPLIGIEEGNGRALLVVPPQGSSGHRAVVTALNPDGQTSQFVDAQTATYDYEPAAQPLVSVTPASLPAGSVGMVEVTGVNTNFAAGRTVAGFGSSDVVVRQVWVLSPTRLLANVQVAASAALAAAKLTVVTGFETAEQPLALAVRAGDPQAPVIDPVAVDPLTWLPSIYAGGQAALSVANLPAAEVSLTIEGQPARVLSVADGKVVFEVPAGLTTGPAVLRVSVGGQAQEPIVVGIDPPPPVVLAVLGISEAPVSATRPAIPGELLRVILAGLADESAVGNPSSIQVRVDGIDHPVLRVVASPADANIHEIHFTLSPHIPSGDQPVTVRVGDRLSQPFSIPVQAAVAGR
jgi:uncharacterized protein (TIGR03437 family)